MESAEHEGIQNHDQQIYAVVAIFCFVSFMAICMRLMAKYLKAQMIDLGDYLAIFSWVAQPLQAVGILLNRPQIVTFAEGILVAEGLKSTSQSYRAVRLIWSYYRTHDRRSWSAY